MTIEGLKDRATLLRLLINDHIKGSDTTHHTQLHKTHTQKGKKASGKRKTARES